MREGILGQRHSAADDLINRPMIKLSGIPNAPFIVAALQNWRNKRRGRSAPFLDTDRFDAGTLDVLGIEQPSQFCWDLRLKTALGMEQFDRVFGFRIPRLRGRVDCVDRVGINLPLGFEGAKSSHAGSAKWLKPRLVVVRQTGVHLAARVGVSTTMPLRCTR